MQPQLPPPNASPSNQPSPKQRIILQINASVLHPNRITALYNKLTTDYHTTIHHTYIYGRWSLLRTPAWREKVLKHGMIAMCNPSRYGILGVYGQMKEDAEIIMTEGGVRGLAGFAVVGVDGQQYLMFMSGMKMKVWGFGTRWGAPRGGAKCLVEYCRIESLVPDAPRGRVGSPVPCVVPGDVLDGVEDGSGNDGMVVTVEDLVRAGPGVEGDGEGDDDEGSGQGSEMMSKMVILYDR